jgi:hypothetical protein
MPGPFEAAGAQKEPSRHAALSMQGELFTGLWTQSGPFRDSPTQYLIRKFYQGTRFDRIIDGINREITSRLTDGRRPGSAVFNSAALPPANCFTSFKYAQNGVEIVKVLQDARQATTPVTLTVASTQGYAYHLRPGPYYIWFVVVTFTTTVPASVNGQTYQFAGLTSATALNGLTLAPAVHPGVTLTAYQQAFSINLGVYGPTSDTGTGVVRVGVDAVLDITTSGSYTSVFSKSAGASKTRFMNLGPTLYMSDGADLVKWMETATTWQANSQVQPGTLINEGTEPGTLQMALGGITMQIAAVASSGTVITIWIAPQSIPLNFPNLKGATVAFAGLTTATYLNGNSYAIASIVSSTLGIFTITLSETVAPETADTGTATTGTGYTAGTAPSFSATEFTVAADGGQQWKCYGTAIKNWGLATPAQAPTLTAGTNVSYWQAHYTIAVFQAILDNNGNVEIAASGKTGLTYPTWPAYSASAPPPSTQDGTAFWQNIGPPGAWAANTAFGAGNNKPNIILDSNGNWQQLTGSTGTGKSGATAPTWATTLSATTTDNDITWTCLGPGAVLSYKTISYSFATHSVDGSVSTAAPPAIIQGPIVGPANTGIVDYIQMAGSWQTDSQIDQIWIFRTAQGQATLILEDQIPADGVSGSFTYNEIGIPDTSTNGNGSLNALIAAPIAEENDPPPAGATGPVYHMGRAWMFNGNVLSYSGGPDTVTGNGITAWPPLNKFTYQAAILRTLPVTVENGGLLVFTTSGVQIVLGTGTSANPFYSTQWCDKVNLANYDVLDTQGTLIYLMEANARVSNLQIEYPFNPQSGYTEIGYPIGDQFLKVTTGGVTSALYNPANCFLSWCVANTQDTAMYVADGAVGWFRMSMVSPPESGYVWSPRAAIGGGTSAVQSVEIAPGVYRLLMGPAAGTTGPVLMRDVTGTVWTDPISGTATPYPSWNVRGVMILCSSGDVATLGWIAAKSKLAGARPTMSVLLDEIGPTVALPWIPLQPTSSDPPDLPPSNTYYSDRYSTQQNTQTPRGDAALVKFDYGSQAYGDELYEFAINGIVTADRPAQ